MPNQQTQTTSADGDRLKPIEYIGYALGDTASGFFLQTFNIFLTYYYVDVWGIPATALLWLLPAVRAFGAFDDVIMGLIADRTNTRWGRCRPYLLFGAIPYGVCGYLMFAGPDFGPKGKIIYAAVTYALMLLSYTVINVPYSAMLGVISPSPRTRTVASTCRFVGAFGAAFLISLFVRPLVKSLGAGSETRGFQLTMAIFAIVSVVLILITFATTKERVRPPPQQKTNAREELGELFKNWPWLVLLITSIFSNAFSALRSGSTIFYFKYVQGFDSTAVLWGLDRTTLFLSSGALGLVLGTMCLGPIARKIDKKYYAAALSLVTGLSFLVETRNGETYMAYLAGRPLRNRGRCTLGRETAIQKMVWDEDDWLRTLDGEGVPTIETPAPGLPVHEFPSALVREDFNRSEERRV